MWSKAACRTLWTCVSSESMIAFDHSSWSMPRHGSKRWENGPWPTSWIRAAARSGARLADLGVVVDLIEMLEGLLHQVDTPRL